MVSTDASHIYMATHSNCGNFLRVSITTFNRKLLKGTRLIAEPNGKNIENWIIRSQAPKFQSSWNMEKVQRLDVCGYEE